MIKKALIIVDMQKGFMNEHTKHLERKIFDFVTRNKDKFGFIVSTKYINNEHTPCYVFEGWKGCMDGTDDCEIVPLLSNIADIVLEKDVYSCWGEFSSRYLKDKIDKVYFIGVNTGCCVLHSVFDAYNDMQDCAVISDLCGSTSGKDSHRDALKILKECITKQRVITVEQFEKEE